MSDHIRIGLHEHIEHKSFRIHQTVKSNRLKLKDNPRTHAIVNICAGKVGLSYGLGGAGRAEPTLKLPIIIIR